MDYNYYLRRSAPSSINYVVNNNTYNTNNPLSYLTYDYAQSFENNNYSGIYSSNLVEYSPYSQTTIELPSNQTNNISNNDISYVNQGFSSTNQDYYSQIQGYSSYPQGYNSQPQNYPSYVQDYSTYNEYNNNYQQSNYDNYFTNKNNYQNNNYNNNYSRSGEIIYYDQYGKEIKRSKNPEPNNFNNYVQGYGLSNNNQKNLIQKEMNKTVVEHSQFSEEQINKWIKEAENQNNTANTNINTYNNTNNNINTFQNQNTQTYNNITTYENTNNNNTNNNNINNNNINNSLINNTNNNITSNNNQIINNTNNTKTNPSQNSAIYIIKLPNEYYFFTIGLNNIGSTCYMNATLQCLLHVSPLISYFKNLYPKDFLSLIELNNSIPSQGYISNAFFHLIRDILIKMYQSSLNNSINDLNPKTSILDRTNSLNKAVSPENFQKTLGRFNPQFKNLEANDSKDLILYLLQVMHQELNYYSKNVPFNGYPNQYNRAQTYLAFLASYDITNYSIISDLFYGTYENVTKCAQCNLYIYNFQKFEFLSFGVSKYHGKEFNIMNGFDDYTKKDQLTGDNKYYCNNCKKLCDAEIQTLLIVPPKYLLINIDYGKNKKYMPSSVKFDEEIDITKYINLNYNKNIRYRIIGVCSHLGDSGISGHYIAFCKNTKNGKWYKFNDSFVSVCTNHSEIMNCGTPYLLLYEMIN